MTPDLRSYDTLLTALLSRRLTPAEFQAVLLPLFKGDQLIRPPEIHDLLNEVFLAAEAYRPVKTADDRYVVTEAELREIADHVLRRLREVVDAEPSS